MNLYVIGYMASGKSTLASAMADAYGLRAVDADAVIESEAGMSCADLFACKGEAAFRRMESELMIRLAASDGLVVATGGGLPCHDGLLELMDKTGLTIYLRWSVESLAVRAELSGIDHRPLMRGLRGAGLRRFIRHHLSARSSCYERARIVIDCDRLTDAEIAQRVASMPEVRSALGM